MKNNLTLVGNEKGYQVFQNADGFMEGYKKIGKSDYGLETQGKDVIRVVSNSKTF